MSTSPRNSRSASVTKKIIDATLKLHLDVDAYEPSPSDKGAGAGLTLHLNAIKTTSLIDPEALRAQFDEVLAMCEEIIFGFKALEMAKNGSETAEGVDIDITIASFLSKLPRGDSTHLG